MKKGLLGILCFLLMTSSALAYDASVNFKQQLPELVAGWYVKAGPTKGGPYANVQDCGKPVMKADSTYDCKVTGYTANPVYAIVVPYDSTKKELAPSLEATASVVVPPPSDIKIVVTIVTVSRITRYGNAIADTTVTRESVPADKLVKEGTVKYRKADGTYYTKTTIVFG
jgi:hypothetical protein